MSEKTITGAAENAANGVEGVQTTNTTTENKTANKGNSGAFTHKFKTPFEYGGETYEEIVFDFNRLNGNDMISIETEMQNQNLYALAPEVSRAFQCLMCARASGVGEDVLRALPFGDFSKITNAARDFLIETGY